MGYSAPHTWAAGDYPTAAYFNQEIRDNVSFLANPPACRVTNTAVQSVGNAAWTAMTFDTELFDTDSMHSTSSNTSRITATTAGLYLFTGAIAWTANATGQRGCAFRKNSSGTNNPTDSGSLYTAVTNTTATYTPAAMLIKLAAADYVELVGYQSSGGPLNTADQTLGFHYFAAVWVGLG